MARRGVYVNIFGDPASLLRALKDSKTELRSFGASAKEVSNTVTTSADRQVRATIALDARLRQQVVSYRQIASAAKKGSQEQIVAASLATKAEERLQRSLIDTSNDARIHARAINTANRELGKFTRGGLAGTGVVSGLGRSLAFASGGFLAFASIGQALRSSVDAATEDAAAQRQLAAQFKANHQSLKDYRDEIEKATIATSQLSGFTETDLTRSFTTAFRATRNVSDALKIERVSAEAARATGRDLGTITLAMTRAVGGASTSIRRLGILVPKTVKGMEVLAYVHSRVAGQAAAGTTAQERFGAAIHNTEVTVGKGILPTLTTYLNKGSEWLNQSKNQAKIQRGLASAIGDVAAALKIAAGAAREYEKASKFLGHLPGPLGTLAKVLLEPGYGLKAAASLLGGGGGGQGGPLKTPAGYVRGTYGYGKSTRSDPGGFLTAYQLYQRGLDPNTYGQGPSTRDNPSGFLPYRKSAGTTPGPGPLGLNAQRARAETAVAKASTTKGAADDRAALVALAKIINEEINSDKKAFRDKKTLYNDLASVQGQIAAIDSSAAQKRTDAQKKANEAAKKAREKEAKERRKGVQQALADTRKAANEAKAQRDQIQQTIDATRQAFGDLFTGSFFNPTDQQQKAALGAPNPQANAKNLVKDLKSQLAAFRSFQKDLATLAKRGAPTQLLSELRAQGLAAAPEVHALATSSKGTLGQFEKLFGQKEALIAKAAKATLRIDKAELHAQRLVVNAVAGKDLWKPTVYVYVDGKVQKATVKTTPHGQTRGRNPGVVHH